MTNKFMLLMSNCSIDNRPFMMPGFHRVILSLAQCTCHVATDERRVYLKPDIIDGCVYSKTCSLVL